MSTVKKYTDVLNTVLKKYPEISLGILFGSVINNRLTGESDIDIAISASRPLGHDKLVEVLLDCEKALKRRVDIIDLQTVTGHILQQILCSGNVFLKKSSPILAELIKKMWYNQADMMPYTNMMMKKQVEKFINE